MAAYLPVVRACTTQSRKALCVYCTVQRGTVCVLHSLERHCVCTAQSREVLCVYCTVQRGTVCVLHSLERHCVCTSQSREVLCVYCTVQRGTLILIVSTNYIFVHMLDNNVFYNRFVTVLCTTSHIQQITRRFGK